LTMSAIIGNGMMATAFRAAGTIERGVCIFASGVSNSRCIDTSAFEREVNLLRQSLAGHAGPSPFVYFGTCSALDPASQHRPYVVHKLAMEQMVLQHPSGLIVRLPQVAGPNPSPYTLLAVLCEAIRSGKMIDVWERASRNIIDVADVVKIVTSLTSMPVHLGSVINVASPTSHSIKNVIEAAELALGRKARINMITAGASYEIDISVVKPAIEALGIDFGNNYLRRVISRYYA
jgi:nucleoside-diphosphate-sugar epimerase